MKDLNKLAEECEADLRSIGIVPGTVVEWSVNTRAKKRWGQCRAVTSDTFAIQIASRLLEDDVSDQAAKNTVLHELLHTVPGCHGHRGRWKELAESVNRLLPEYTVKRTTTEAEKGVSGDPPTYVVVCADCGREYGTLRMTRLIRTPGRFRCGICGGKLKRIQ